MNIKIHSSELNRMMKVIAQCTDPKDNANKANIEIGNLNNQLYIHASDGHFSATMTTPMLGLDDEKFCVDGQMFARVCAMCNGEVQIITDDKTCTIKGAGRTKLPIVNANIPRHEDVIGKKAVISAEQLNRCYGSVAYAVSTDTTRLYLTGILTEVNGGKMKMTSLDGFQMSIESAECEGDEIKAIIPATFLKLVTQATSSGEDVTIYTDGHRIAAQTDSMALSCGLLTGDYPDVARILPTEFKTECMVNAAELMNALKSGSVVNNKQNLVKMEISENSIRVMNNSEEADFEADINCDTHGPDLKIAFNLKYLMNTINAIAAENVILHFNTSVTPCVATCKDEDGVRLVLPVRVQG